MSRRLLAVFATGALLALPAAARAQGSTSILVSGGLSVPMSDLSDNVNSGYNINLGLAFGAPIIPVGARIEGGFSSTTSDLIHRIEEIIGVGASGVNLEDGVGPSHEPRPLEAACDRIAAARQAAAKLGVPLVINARTDIYLNAGNNDPSLLDSALVRAKAYIAAGADCVYPIGLLDIGEIRRFVSELRHPVNIHGRRGTPPISVLQAAGVARVSTATTPAVFVAGVLSDAMTKLIQSGSFDHFASSFDYARLQKLFS